MYGDYPLPGRPRAHTPPAPRLITLRACARAQVLAAPHRLRLVGGGSLLESGWRLCEREERRVARAPAMSGTVPCLSHSRAGRATAHPLAPASRPLAGARRVLCASLKVERTVAYRRRLRTGGFSVTSRQVWVRATIVGYAGATVTVCVVNRRGRWNRGGKCTGSETGTRDHTRGAKIGGAAVFLPSGQK